MSDAVRAVEEMAPEPAGLERELAEAQLRLVSLRLRLFSWRVGLAFIAVFVAGIYVGKFA